MLRTTSSWVTYVDIESQRMTVLSAAPFDRYAVLQHDNHGSVPGAYDVWRERDAHWRDPAAERTGVVRRVDIDLSRDGDATTVPAHVLPPHAVRRTDLLTLWAVGSPFMWWTHEAVEPASDDNALGHAVSVFMAELLRFPGFVEATYTIGALRHNTKWEWGYGHGVYCFISAAGEVQYVGRSLGSTLGERIWNQMESQQDPEWKAIVVDPATVVRVFAADDELRCMASALEAFLIERLKPKFNLRRQ